MNSIARFNLSRLLLNVLFAGLIVFVSIKNNGKILPVGCILLYNVLLFIPPWINNFWLFPKLRLHKNIRRYLLNVIILFFLSVIIIGQYLKWLYEYFEKSELSDFTALAIHISLPSSFEKYQHYLDVAPGIMLLLCIMTLGYVVQEYILKIKKEESIQAQQNIAELSLLKSQISPHFLFNILNSLYALSLKTSKETPAVILKLSDILRYSLYETQEKEIAISQEIHILHTYLAIERLRIPANTRISFRHDEVKDSIKIAPMLLLPLIENAFKHGVDSTIDVSYIDANLYCDNNKLIFECENSFKERVTKDKGGIGIENIRKRLQLLYPSRHVLQIVKKEDTFRVTLEIKF
ncbi:histidine kinase [Myroides sp. 1354]|uniref:sensor histidine kinase n=1 Tax=unclassified Myroides TaxID=2642485 RepID=UPI00257657BE|nr:MULTISPECIES: histidine kinase [unclassified Myroides]MDM1046049.1 histidine kinase [Myroides sp. R163-1]MDM1056985.1 histidine kinase [Myroides sp. 1354]MDM1070180.1 histidine kinase [Myroides sp. 1372]